jgi:hypothetical protein
MRSTIRSGRTPEPPINPPERKPSASEHHLSEPSYDHDGPSVKQQEQMDSPILHVITEHYSCVRDGCDAAETRDYLYTMDGMSDRLQAAVRGAVRRREHGSWADDCDETELMAEYVATHAEIVDYDDGPVLDIDIGGHKLGYWTHDRCDERRTASGQCYGHIDEATIRGI